MASEIGVQKLMHTNATQAATINSSGQLIIDDGLQKSEGGAVNTSIQQGLAKSWVNFNASSTIVARDSFNSSSLTDHSTGRHSNNYTNNMENVNYNHASCGGNTHSNLIAVMQHVGTNAPTTSSARYHVTYVNSNNYDAQFVGVNIFGDLA